MGLNEELEKQAIEHGCKLGHNGLIGVVSNRLAEFVVSTSGKSITLYQDGKNKYLGYTHKEADCPNCIPLNGIYFCQNPARIEQNLTETNRGEKK